MNLPKGLTVSVMSDDGAELVFRIEGSVAWVAERLGAIGGLAILMLPMLAPGSMRKFTYDQAVRG